MRIVLSLLLFLSFNFSLSADNYQKAWEALAKNDRATARQLLEKALNEPANAADAALTLMLIDIFDGTIDDTHETWEKAVANLKDPYPYYFPLWFEAPVTGGYGQKEDHQVKLLKRLIADPKCPGYYKAAAKYALGHHYLTESEFKDMREIRKDISQLTEWQFTGPFDNLAGSGFDKNYAPITHPEPNAVFKSTYNADIKWFTPGKTLQEGWIPTGYYIRNSTAVAYAQTFVTAPSDMEVILAAGFTGNIRIWVNDQLIISEQEYLRTDFDLFKSKCRLHKGNNRVLVQLGFEDAEYPNFCIRFVDEQSNLVPGLVNSPNYAPYQKASGEQPAAIPFAAEVFFQQKVKSEPDNLLNYILLAKTYVRSNKLQDAIAVIEKAVEKAPDNSLLLIEYIDILNKIENRTDLTREVQHIKETDPTSAVAYVIRHQEFMNSEQYDDAEKELAAYEKKFPRDENVYEKYIKLYLAQKKIKEVVSMIDEASDKYPANSYFNEMKHNVALMLRKDPQGANRINEQFLKRNLIIPVAMQLVNEYYQIGQNDKAVRMLNQYNEQFPGEYLYLEKLFQYYYSQKENKKAATYVTALLSQAPYHAPYHELAAHLYEQSEDNEAALAAFQKVLEYDPNDFDARRRIRDLQKRTDLNTLLPQNDPYEMVKKSKPTEKQKTYDWYYILDEKSTILYPERCSEMYHTLIIRVINENGIDKWKESSIGYNEYRQRLIIEKAEVIKPNGSKFTAEQNGADIVFTNLEKGDAIYLRYRTVSYAYGRIAREFWDSYNFNSTVPCETSRYVIVSPKDLTFDIKTLQTDLKPAVRDVDDVKIYTWETTNEPALKPESLMPSPVDVYKSVSVSTIRNWQEIADWYSDLSTQQAKQDLEIQTAVKNLFPQGRTFSPQEKARAIYDFILKNIRYSSVPFRQGAYMPQKASKVLQTKLGDCKDVSTLYAAMAREAGLEANLVLLCTRDNGEEPMPLPSAEFNHCIVKVKAGQEIWYLELTDSSLPFGSLPGNDLGGAALEIPYNGSGAKAGIFKLYPSNRTVDYRRLKTQIDIKNRDMEVSTHSTLSGVMTRNLRGDYATLNTDEQKENMQKWMGKRYTNPIVIKKLNFGNLEALNDTLQYRIQFQARNEIIEIGELRTFRIPFFYTFLQSDMLQEELEARTFPVNYWEYEDADEYLEEFTVNLPEGKQFTEIPKDVTLAFGGSEYKLTYKKAGATSIQVTRQIKVKRDIIPVNQYAAFRQFIDDVVSAENRYIAFK